MKQVHFGGIVTHRMHMENGYGFKITFMTAEEAQRYKTKIQHMMYNDGYILGETTGYYDKDTRK